MITNALRSAETEEEVLFLLTTYVEAARTSGRFHFLPERAVALPLVDSECVRSRLTNMLYELDEASRSCDDYTRDVLHEAVHIFGRALEQIHAIRHRHGELAA
jgi:hypothetical protein